MIHKICKVKATRREEWVRRKEYKMKGAAKRSRLRSRRISKMLKDGKTLGHNGWQACLF